MIGRRTFVVGGFALAASSSVRAQSSRPMVVFLGDQASAECKTWRTQWEPLFTASDGYKKLDYRVVYPADSAQLLMRDSWPPHLRWILDTFLASEGVRDFDAYRVDPNQPLSPDIFVPDNAKPP